MTAKALEHGILTKRELDVLQLMANEYTIREIATTLFIGMETVKTHRKNMKYKLEVKSAVGLIVRALELGVLVV